MTFLAGFECKKTEFCKNDDFGAKNRRRREMDDGRAFIFDFFGMYRVLSETVDCIGFSIFDFYVCSHTHTHIHR